MLIRIVTKLPFELGGEQAPSTHHDKLGGLQVLVLNINGTNSREELETIFSGLKMIEMALSNQSDFVQFNGLRQGKAKSCRLSSLS
jgi:hypothetical protein